MSRSKIYELEGRIMDCWSVEKDLESLFTAVMETEMSKDDIANVLLGIKGLVGIRFNVLLNAYEIALKEQYENRNS